MLSSEGDLHIEQHCLARTNFSLSIRRDVTLTRTGRVFD
jgi:hypothetical protein